MRIRWTPRARVELQEIVRTIARDRPEAVRRMRDQIREAVMDLSHHPEIGRVVPELSDLGIRERIVRPYRVVYLLDEKLIWIVAVFHGRRQMSEIRDRLDPSS